MAVKANAISNNRTTMFIRGGLITVAVLSAAALLFGLFTLPDQSPVVVEPASSTLGEFYTAPVDAYTARWVGLSEYYTAPVDAYATRWTALGEFYTAPVDAYTARWVGLGEYYTAPVDAYAARWAGLGEYYAAQDMLATASTANRWAAMGEFYMSQAKAQGGNAVASDASTAGGYK